MFYNEINGVLVYDKARTVAFVRATETAFRSKPKYTIAELAKQMETDAAMFSVLLIKKDTDNA